MSNGQQESTAATEQLGLPRWPAVPGGVDPTGSSYLIVAAGREGEIGQIAKGWVAEAEAVAATLLVVVDSMSDPRDRDAVTAAFAAARTGVRIMVVGGQHDVMVALAAARSAGALAQELTAYVTDTSDLPLYCAHCRDTFRVEGAPGSIVDCPGCMRSLEIHPHHSAVLGSFLASASDARELP